MQTIEQQASERGIEVYPPQGIQCTCGRLEGSQWQQCGKPAIRNVAQLTHRGWRMDDVCKDHLEGLGITA